MVGYTLRRFGHLLVALAVIATLVFVLFRLAFPDPTLVYLDLQLSEETRQLMIERFGLDEPLWRQYFTYWSNLAFFEFGTSFFYRAPVGPIVADRLLNTLALMVPPLMVAYLLGPALGVLLTRVRGTRRESAGIAGALVLRSAPLFWTGMMAVMVFVVWLGWFPTGGMRTAPYQASGFLDKVASADFLWHLMLPASVLAVFFAGVPMLLMRNTMLEVVGEDFVEYAEARGLSVNRVLFAHVARNSLLPVVTQAAVTAGLAVGGQVAIEVVFSWPGLGREMLNAVSARDYPLAQAAFLLLASGVLVLNLVADLLYGWLDPRVTHRSETSAAGGR